MAYNCWHQGWFFCCLFFFSSLRCRIFLHMYSIIQQQLQSLLYELGSVVKRASQVAQWVKNPAAGQETKADVSSNLGSPGGGHGNPLQYSCLKNPMDRGVLWATPHRVAKSQTWLKRLSMHTHGGKEPACDAGDTGSVPGSERSTGEGNGNPAQDSCLGNPMDRGAWWATAHEISKESDTT